MVWVRVVTECNPRVARVTPAIPAITFEAIPPEVAASGGIAILEAEALLPDDERVSTTMRA